MRWWKSLTSILLCVCVCVFVTSGALRAQEVSIDGIRFGQNGDTTRFVIDLSKKTEPQIFLLSSPNRVVIDIPNASWDNEPTIASSGVIAGYRHGLFSAGVYRIVLDLKEAAIVQRAFPLPAKDGYSSRYVIDLKPAGQRAFEEAVTVSRANRKAQPKPSQPTVQATVKRNGKRIIVIDPGHGGVDPGTLGRGGANEKTIALKISKAIKRQLDKTGRYRVHLTRETDIYIPHRQRFGKAKALGADLFISVHVDSINNPKVRGGTVYTLNEKASDSEAARLAAKENRSDILAGVDLAETNTEVSDILIELAQRETMNSSAKFAEILVPEMRQQVKMHKRAHRFANLIVLKSPDVPSVLLETGYITNKADARLLNSKDGGRRISHAIHKAVDRYFDTLLAEGR